MVQRYTPDILGTNENSGYADCVLSPRGEYVTHADYATLFAAHKKLCEAVTAWVVAEDRKDKARACLHMLLLASDTPTGAR